MQNVKRPISVTIIAWIILVMSALVLISTFLTSVWWGICGLIGIVSGVAMLKGLNWGRLLYLWAAPISIVLESLVLGFNPTDIVRAALYLVILFFLTRPVALKYFCGSGMMKEKKKEEWEKKLEKNAQEAYRKFKF